MIEAQTRNDLELARRLEARADRLARAWLENRRRARRADPTRWRRPRLLWPLFAEDM